MAILYIYIYIYIYSMLSGSCALLFPATILALDFVTILFDMIM